jgi:release factor glutamine methyltransferase
MTADELTVGGALRRAKALRVERLDAQLLLAAAAERPRSWLFAHEEEVLEPAAARAFLETLARRAVGEPIAYLLGTIEFHGLTLEVNANVLIPRPDTEVLVDWAIELLGGEFSRAARPQVVDLGTGSGAIALAVKHACPATDVLASDLDAGALAVARGNARRLELDVAFIQGSWWEALQGRRFDLALSNPPYIAGGDRHLTALAHEPELALTPGGDGLGALREIIATAHEHLQRGGWLLLEHGFDQASAVHALLQLAGFGRIETRRDLGGQPRCTGGCR